MQKLFTQASLIAIFLFTIAACTNQNNRSQNSSLDDSNETTLWIIRHGKTMLNTTDRVQGWADAPLTPAGIEVIEYLAKGLKEIPFVAAYSSDSGRARETAHLILHQNNQKNLLLQDDWRLREFNFGSYEGAYNHEMWSDIAQSQNKTLEEWMQSMTPSNFADSVAALDRAKVLPAANWPAEDFATISRRLMQSLEAIIEQNPQGGDILIVSHGLSMMAIMESIDPSFRLESKSGLSNGSLLKIIYNPLSGYRIESANDMSYIERGKNLRIS